jgi:hypothetical protein
MRMLHDLLIRPGQWVGRGSLLPEGANRGDQLTCELEVSGHDGGYTIAGELKVADDAAATVSVRIALNEAGTYTVDARVAGVALDGVAKLASEPNLGLLWNEAGTQSATFTLFTVNRALGFRGFARLGRRMVTWEIAISPRQLAVGGANVVSLAGRGRPRRR